jgi:hypothetical protein
MLTSLGVITTTTGIPVVTSSTSIISVNICVTFLFLEQEFREPEQVGCGLSEHDGREHPLSLSHRPPVRGWCVLRGTHLDHQDCEGDYE